MQKTIITYNQPASFYFYDFETFGIHPALDRPAQFAGVRTDSDFNIIEPPLVIYSQPSQDYLPQPEAVLLTGITPQKAQAEGLIEVEFAKQIHAAFSQPNTCILGYNSIRFDDEVSRYLFYRNMIDPYAYSWQNGNSRWDLLDLVRTCYALRPEGLNWQLNDEGVASFKLELLTKANNLVHLQAHDALSDVYATIALAKRIKEVQPRLFDYLFQLRHKQNITKQIDIADMTPLLHVSGMFGGYRHNISLVAPIAWHPEQKNKLIVCDLQSDITPLLELDSQTLLQRLYTPKADLTADQLPIPLKLIHINKCPVIAPVKTLREPDAARLGLDREHCLRNWQLLRQHTDVREKVINLYAESTFVPSTNVDAQLYDNFFNNADKTTMQMILQTAPDQLAAFDARFNDRRLEELFFRFRARNYPGTLNNDEQSRWLQHCRDQLSSERIENYLHSLNQLAYQYENQPEKAALLKELFNYGKKIAG